MKSLLSEISGMVHQFGSAPTFSEMPRRKLEEKGIAGPTAAHVIEEIHTPLNFAYLTFTTGSSAFQNIVGITHAELKKREVASVKALTMAGVEKGNKILCTYPPLVNVFWGEALQRYGVEWSFLVRSSRDAFLAALYEMNPDVVLGESSFIRAALEDAIHLGVAHELPQNIIILTAGTPLDLELIPIAEKVLNAKVHDLYGCQEFGWLALDGIPVRDDLTLVSKPNSENKDFFEVVVGGLPMGDSFPISETGHVCNPKGKIITYRRRRSYPEMEVIVKQTTLNSKVTLERVARSILRIKSRIVKVDPQVVTGADTTVLHLIPDPFLKIDSSPVIIEGPVATGFFDDLVKAQIEYQQNGKADPVWKKRN